MKLLSCLILTLFLSSCISLNLTNLFNSKEFQKIKFQTKREEASLDFTLKNEIPFNCPKIPSNHPDPEDATKLRFSDIKVMMALGDSITAGFAMQDESYVGSIFDYRGGSGFIGGDENVPSLFNYFKKIGNPIIGGSVGRGFPWSAVRWPWHIRPHNPPVDRLNGAQSNARTHHMEKQVDYVATEAAKDPKINYLKDWKVVTILMGANDLFACESPNSHPDVFIKRLNETISRIDQKIPRIFINLFTLFEDGFIDTYNNGKDSLYCRAFWKVLESGIPCMVKSDALRSKMKGMIVEYNKRIEALAKWWNQKRRKDFYIAVQPMLSHLRVLDRSWSSKFDCFHPSLKANKLISQSLWNSMQLPWDKKPRGTVDKILCPDQNTFLQ